MLTFPNCKINLGLNIIEKRNDGFHNIETVFYPLNYCDALEIIENKETKTEFEFNMSGIPIAGNLESNLIYKAYNLIKANYSLPNIKVFLHKNIPMGAGLGGGSADAAFFMNVIDKKFNLNIDLNHKLNIANLLGSDCAFFIKNKPVYASEKGNVFSECKINLSDYFILIVYPNIHSNTKEAYHEIIPKKSGTYLKSIIEKNNIDTWKELVTNDFEIPIFKKYPIIKNLKEQLYKNGAVYASLSGSGSAVFGIFENEPSLEFYKHFPYYLQRPQQMNL